MFKNLKEEEKNHIQKILYFSRYIEGNLGTFLISPLYGSNLSEIKINNKILNEIAIQSILALQQCHNINLIHCDIKPQNFVWKNNLEQILILIDFGASTKFIKNEISDIEFLKYIERRRFIFIIFTRNTKLWNVSETKKVLK